MECLFAATVCDQRPSPVCSSPPRNYRKCSRNRTQLLRCKVRSTCARSFALICHPARAEPIHNHCGAGTDGCRGAGLPPEFNVTASTTLNSSIARFSSAKKTSLFFCVMGPLSSKFLNRRSESGLVKNREMGACAKILFGLMKPNIARGNRQQAARIAGGLEQRRITPRWIRWMWMQLQKQPQPPILLSRFGAMGCVHQFGDGHHRHADLDGRFLVADFPKKMGLCPSEW